MSLVEVFGFVILLFGQHTGSSHTAITIGNAYAASTMDGWSSAIYLEPSKIITLDGAITKWQYHVRNWSPITFQVWRWYSGSYYTLVGQNYIYPASTGSSQYMVPSYAEIQVRYGDIIGFMFRRGSVIPYNATICEPERYIRYNRENYVLQIGDFYKFETKDDAWGSCRSYSLSATVEILPGRCTHIDDIGEDPGYYRYILSPMYRSLDRNWDLCWVIKTSRENSLLLATVIDSHTTHPSCNFYYLELRDGQYTSSDRLVRWCRDEIPSNQRSTGDYMRLALKGYGYFNISFVAVKDTVGCRAVTLDEAGTYLTSPGYPFSYYRNEDRCWRVNTEADRISVYVNDMDLEWDSFCQNDYVSLYDGSSQSAPRIVTWCGTFASETVVTPGYEVYIEFRSDGFGYKRGFKLTLYGWSNDTPFGMTGVLGKFLVPILVTGGVVLIVIVILVAWKKKKKARHISSTYPRQQTETNSMEMRHIGGIQQPVVPGVFQTQHHHQQIMPARSHFSVEPSPVSLRPLAGPPAAPVLYPAQQGSADIPPPPVYKF